MGEKQSNVMKFLPEIYGKEIFYIDMKKSYRSTCEIMQFAEQLIQENSETEYVDRHGELPHTREAGSIEQMYEMLAEDLRDGSDCRTQGVLCLTQEEAESVWSALKEKGIEADLLTKDSMKFRTGISVMPFYLAKGLEFDQVFSIFPKDEKREMMMQAQYIAATRALHELRVYHI